MVAVMSQYFLLLLSVLVASVVQNNRDGAGVSLLGIVLPLDYRIQLLKLLKPVAAAPTREIYSPDSGRPCCWMLNTVVRTVENENSVIGIT